MRRKGALPVPDRLPRRLATSPGLMQAAMRRVADGRLFLIPASAETLGHNTTANAVFWRDALGAFLREVP